MRTRARNADVGGGRTRFASGGEWPARVDEYVVEEPERGTIDPVRKQQFPIVGDGRGIWSWIHLDDAAAASVLALEQDGPGIYNIVDDDPAPVREWLPVLAQALGAKLPRRFPTWLARLLAGDLSGHDLRPVTHP
jgi:nucleoside-diphosphate-sugar epimerase